MKKYIGVVLGGGGGGISMIKNAFDPKMISPYERDVSSCMKGGKNR